MDCGVARVDFGASVNVYTILEQRTYLRYPSECLGCNKSFVCLIVLVDAFYRKESGCPLIRDLASDPGKFYN